MIALLLAWRNANGNPFRSWTVSICAALMAGFAVSATVIIGGAQQSLALALERLGADIIVVSAGSEEGMENAFLMGVPVATWMPSEYGERVAAIGGVEAVSPQFYLATLRGASCCSVPEMFLIGYDPVTDFTLRPWLEENVPDGLAQGEAVGGAFVYVPRDPGYILVYGHRIDLQGNLEQTGTGLDQSMFFTFETAQEIARLSPMQAEKDLVIPGDSVSSLMVKTRRGGDTHRIASEIEAAIPGVTAVESSNLFHSQRVLLLGLRQSVIVLMGIAWFLAVVLVGLVFSIAVNERRQEIGMLRALGMTRGFILRSLLGEGLVLAAGGGIAGIGFFGLAVYLFRTLVIRLMGVPFLIPSFLPLAALVLAALLLTWVSVTLGALIPSVRIVLMEPALAMRK